MDAASFLSKGAPVTYILLLLSIYGLGIVFYKLYQFVALSLLNTRYINVIMNEIKTGDRARAEKMIASIHSPITRVMGVALACVQNRQMSQENREAEIIRVATWDLRYLESHMRGLELVGNIGPLLGLLGTVTGMVKAFARLEAAGARVDPSILAGGIWESLITTVGGLIVAIPAVAAYYGFDALIERVRTTMKDVAVQILSLDDEYKVVEQQQALKVEGDKKEEAREASIAPQQLSTLRLLSPNYTRF